MADNLHKNPSKGILKTSSSFDKQDKPQAPSGVRRKSNNKTTWDEMNIIATLHPADKDYGHMKIDEPKTPYNYMDGEESIDGAALDPAKLEEKMRLGAGQLPKVLQSDEDDSDDEEYAELSPEERAKRKEFEHKRKKHYNEFYAVKLARKLLEEEDDNEEEQANSGASTSEKHSNPQDTLGTSQCCSRFK